MTRTTAISVSMRRPLGVLLLLGVLITLFSGVFGISAAHAAECTPEGETSCVQGSLRTSAGDPASGVSLTLSGPVEDQTTSTDEEGKWAFTVTEMGTYTVTVDESTLPEGQFLKGVSSRDFEVDPGRVYSGLFPMTDDPEGESAEEPSDAAGEDEPGATPAPVEDGASADGGAAVNETPGSFSWPRFWQQFVSGIRLGLLVALASVGLSLIFGTTGLSNFAHGEMVSLGGLLAATFMTLTGNLLLTIVIAVAVMALFGWAQDKVLWKPLRKRRLSLMQLMIVSIGLSIAMQYLFQFFFGAGVVRIDTSTPSTVTFFGVSLTVQSVWIMAISLVAIILVGLALTYTRFGRATRAIADNPALALASGIDVDRVINVVWVVGAGLAGLSGVFLGLVFNGLTFFTGGQMLLLFFAAVTLGGLGTAFGAVVGSMLVGMMVELTNIWLPGDLKYATALLLLILVLLVRPQGIFGRKERIG